MGVHDEYRIEICMTINLSSSSPSVEAAMTVASSTASWVALVQWQQRWQHSLNYHQRLLHFLMYHICQLRHHLTHPLLYHHYHVEILLISKEVNFNFVLPFHLWVFIIGHHFYVEHWMYNNNSLHQIECFVHFRSHLHLWTMYIMYVFLLSLSSAFYCISVWG